MNAFYNERMEKLTRGEIARLQEQRLKSLVDLVYANVPYYADKMKEKGVLPGDIKTLSDLAKLPFVSKDDLRVTYPFGMFATDMKNIVRIHASSGTTGKQTVVGYTESDIVCWAECMARCLVMAGADTSSRVQVCYGYGLFTGGLGAHYGAEKLGAVTIPASTGNTKRQIQMLTDFGSTHLCCTPSYALYLAEALEEAGMSAPALKAGVFGAEPFSPGLRREIESHLNIKAFDIYGLSEVMGPGVAQECACQDGLHIWEDIFIAEIIDPQTGEPLPDGQQGELVFTTIGKRGFPLIRYRTRDISSLTREECGCGRFHARMAKPSGRTDDMLIIRGVNVFPSQIEEAILAAAKVSHYQIVVEKRNNLDVLTVEVEVSPEMVTDYMKGLEEIEKKIRSQIESTLGISCNVRLVEPKTVARSEGKAKRVIDLR